LGFRGGYEVRTAEIDYDLDIGGIKALLTVSYEIEFHSEGRGTDEATVGISARPLSIQTMIGGMPFSMVKWEDVRKDYPLYDWIRSKATSVSLEDCGYTLQEALREAIEEEDESAYWENQIGRPT
jgi:hypothetical protein